MEKKVAGLSTVEVEQRFREYGPNVIDQAPRGSVGKLALKQMMSPLMLLLLVALIVTLILGDFLDTVVIGLALLVNTALGFWQEFKAEKSLQALNRVLIKKVQVIRDGKRKTILSEEIVPGDVVVIGAGERVAVDGILIESNELMVNEAVLTGEAMAIPKPVKAKILAGTAVVSGEGIIMTEKTGSETEIGKIAQTLSKTPEAKTPLQLRLEAMGRTLSWLVILLIGGLVWLGYIVGLPLSNMVMVAVAVGVAAIPEGLAISLTAILTVGMRRILAKKALVRKLLAAEVLGSVSVICTDKTGTLTLGVMKVKKVEAKDMALMLRAAIVATGGVDQLEIAWREWAESTLNEYSKKDQAEKVNHRRPFNSEDKYSLTLTDKNIYLVGAPEVILRMALMPENRRVAEMVKVANYARQGYRIIAASYCQNRGVVKLPDKLREGQCHYLGLVVFEDKPRDNLRTVMREVERAGVKVKVITGDYAETGKTVMRQIGLTVNNEAVLLGDEVEALMPEELMRRVGEVKLFARVNPNQKYLIVKALQRMGEVVAMTGDGVNDALALKQADVGIVVSTATEVAQETADMVLLDDNFATIVAAIEEGRGMYKNLRKVILYLMADSLTQVLLVVGALLSGLPMVLTTVQVLWINLVTDSLPALALTVDPHVLGLMDKLPRKVNEPIINGKMGRLMGLISVVTALIVFGGFYYLYKIEKVPFSEAQTWAFSLTAVICIMVVFSSRSMMTPLWRDRVFRNWWLVIAVAIGLTMQLLAVYWAPLQQLLGTAGLSFDYWMWVILLCLLVLGIVEAVKLGLNSAWRRQLSR